MSNRTDILQFDDAELVRKLCGANHSTLALIEDAFDVYVEAPGSSIVACRPAVDAGERLGFLPGDFNEKVDPYMQPIWDALNFVLGREDVERRRAAGEIEVVPVAFMRGRTLSDAFVVIDEAQNATIPQMKMILTRLGERAKYAVTGDPGQSDLPRGVDSGLAHALGILKGIKGIKTTTFLASDVL